MKNKRTAARRGATFLAALGALVMSSGIALMVAATPAHAEGETNNPSYWETLPGESCSKVDDSGKESGGYTVPSEPADWDWSKLIIKKGNGDSQGEENTVYNNPVAGETYYHASGSGYSHVILCKVPEPEEEPLVASAAASPNTPTCADTVASYTKSGSNIEAAWDESAAPAFGATITVTAHAVAGAEFAGGGTTKAIDVTFPPAATGCTTEVSPPQTESSVIVSTPKKHKTQSTAVTPTVVHAGLTGATVQDMRGEQGLALMVAGMVMLAAAGGLGLRLRGGESRI